MLTSSSSNETTAFPTELALYSAQVEAAKSAGTFRSILTRVKDGWGAPSAQLMPLRERDITALNDFFAGNDLEEIEADVNSNLLWLYPEPCWEDTFDLLENFV